MKLRHTLYLLFFGFAALMAAEPASYYANAYNTQDNALRLALFNIIKGHTDVSYNGLWNVYRTSDIDNNGDIWDMYSTCTFNPSSNQCGNYTDVCDCYNREHSIPKSWFNDASPMISDAFHIYPTDGMVNAQRSNFPYGECSKGTKLSSNALGRLGNSTFPGYTTIGIVFEPDDEYKGDFARTYFYMATRYANLCSSWGHNTFGNVNGLTNYAVALFLKWHREDPVSPKEIARNEAIYGYQHNRNPFIDYPELAEYIWGNRQGQPWNGGATELTIATHLNIALESNPVSSKFTLMGEDAGSLSYCIYNIVGECVQQGETVVGSDVDITKLSGGLYIIRIAQEEKSTILKLVVK